MASWVLLGAFLLCSNHVQAKLLPFPCELKHSDAKNSLHSETRSYDNRLDMVRALVSPGGVVAEVGVFAGEFARALYDAVEPSQLYLIDPWPEGEEISSGDVHGANIQSVQAEALFQSALARFQNQTLRSDVHILRDYSASFLSQVGVGTLDAIYLDGDHTYGGVMVDLLLSVCAVKPGGWIMGHDYDANPDKAPVEALEYPKRFGVRKAVDKLLRLTGFHVHAIARDGLVSFAVQRE